ncbi:hypothetical protein [Leeuwenhoekiella parthenopeia]|uniref:Uncharacterized protein n=1 Tax=Leeuwenhoekiella parthenopeia TaxID=2890320 RepID=A0ABS8GQC3_9FLAO|nr:hypothetical protein [Leeuwenhoekiella parthenopeia]MCC4211351.1 hypothetical protein [Leeuwenhoekiella parthenopeia]
MYKATDEQIKAWKEQYGTVFYITAPNANKAAYLRSPSRKTMSFVGQIKDPMKFNEALLKNCWIEGDQEMQTNDSIFMGLSDKLAMVLDFEETKLEKL